MANNQRTRSSRSELAARQRPSQRPPPTRWSPRSTTVVMTLVALTVSLAISLFSLSVIVHSWRGIAAQLDDVTLQYGAVRKSLRERHIQELANFVTTEILIRDLQLIYDEPLSEALGLQLQSERQLFTDLLQQSDERTDDPVQLGDANIALGMIHSHLNETHEATKALTMAYHMFSERYATSHQEVDERRVAVTASRISWTLAAQGKFHAAEKMASDAAQRLSAQAKKRNHDPGTLRELVIATRNHATTRAALDRQSTADVSTAIAAGKLLLQAQSNAESSEALKQAIFDKAFLADSFQIQAAWLRKRNQLEEAAAHVSEAVTLLESLLADIHRLTIIGGILPTHRYQAGLEMAHCNLSSLQAAMKAPNKHKTLTRESWQWRKLHALPSQLIDESILTEGRLPGEFEDHDALAICWGNTQWCDEVLIQLVQQIHNNIELMVLVGNTGIQSQAERLLEKHGMPKNAVQFCTIPTATPWIRDYGPWAITSDEGTKFVDTIYSNAVNRIRDDHVPFRMAELLNSAHIPLQLSCDGGGILSNGQGICLVSSVMLHRNLARGFSEEAMTSTLKRLTGAHTLIYLEPLHGEPTGHIDMFATFTDPNTLVLGDYGNRDLVNSQLLDRHAERLANTRTANGNLKVVRIPMPTSEHNYFPTYTNVVFANGKLLVPTWAGSPPGLDEVAIATYKELLPDWQIVGIPSREVGLRRGSLHCLTMHIYRNPSLHPRLPKGLATVMR